MNAPDTSLRLRPLVSAVVFLSGYAPLLVILVVKDLAQTPNGLTLESPLRSGLILAVAIFSSAIVLLAARSIKSGLPVKVTKATNKSGEMFGYTIPYVISFMKVDPNDWQTLVCLGIFLTMMFILAYERKPSS
jgi:hypothetical protein